MAGHGILYAVVARGPVVLAEYSSVQGNTSIVAVQLLDKINASNGERSSYTVDSHAFHVLAFGRRIPFAFLDDIRGRFSTQHGAQAATGAAYEFSDSFGPILRERALYYSDPRADNVTRVRGEVENLREVMVDSIERVLERGERLELLVQRTDNLSESAFVFKRGTTQLKRRMWWRNARTMSCAVLLVIGLLYLLAAFMCSPTLQHC